MDVIIKKEEDENLYCDDSDHPMIYCEKNILDGKTNASNVVTLRVDPNAMCIKEEPCTEESEFGIEYLHTEVKEELPVKSEDIEIKPEEIGESTVTDCEKEKNHNLTTSKRKKDGPTVFRCTLCQFTTTERQAHWQHQDTHKDATDQMYYKCHHCDHRTTQKTALKLHLLTHMDPTKVTWYKCTLCPYASKLKGGLKVHMLTHKNISEECANNVPVEKPIRSYDLCPICYMEVSNFSRHLFHKHSDNETIRKISSMSVNSTKRKLAIGVLRKKGNFILHEKNSKFRPVRKSRKACEEEYVPCISCLGYYKRNYLWRHKKNCPARNLTEDNRDCGKKRHLTESQTFVATKGLLGNYLAKTQLKKEVFAIMRPDKISLVAKSDPLICLYGESYLNIHKGKHINLLVSNKMREFARLKITLQKNTTINNLVNVLNPEIYNDIVVATKIISGYVAEKGTFKSSSLAIHLGTSLKYLCDVARKAIVKNNPILGPFSRKVKQVMLKEITELKEMIESHWSNDIASLVNKIQIEKQFGETKLVPLTKDIQLFYKYVSNLGDNAFCKLNNKEDVVTNYKLITECTLCLVLLYNRKRIGEIQFLDIKTYQSVSTINQEEWLMSLSELEKNMSANLKIIVVFGKESKPVPLLFTNRMQTYINVLLKNREAVNIPDTNKYVFAYPESQDTWISVASVLRNYAYKCDAKTPILLTNSRFGKQIATILQLMSFESSEMVETARFMGHTKTPVEFFRLTEDVYLYATVAKVLLLMNAGKGGEYKGKSLSEIQLALDEIIFDENGKLENCKEEQLKERRSERQHDINQRTIQPNKINTADGQSDSAMLCQIQVV